MKRRTTSKLKTSTTAGVLVMGVEGMWRPGEFATFLQSIESAYLRLNTIQFISEEFDHEIQEFSRNLVGSTVSLEGGGRVPSQSDLRAFRKARIYDPERQDQFIRSYARRDFEPIMTAARRRTMGIDILSIRISSPGWVEFVGSLNPLKLIADFITNWRAENTKREQIRSRERTERIEVEEQETTKRMKIRADLAASLLDRLEEVRDLGPPEITGRFIDYTVGISQEKLERIAKDVRLTNSKVRPL